MNIQDREDRNNFIHSLPDYLWINWLGICGTVLDFYAHEKPKFNADNDLDFFVSLLKGEEKGISSLRDNFQNYIEKNNGEFKELKPFPKYFRPRDQKIVNPERERLRIELFRDRNNLDEIEYKERIDKINKIQEDDNPEYQALTKNEEAEHCFYWSMVYCRNCFNDQKELEQWLPNATFLYGYACGLLGIDSEIMIYRRLNKDKTTQEKGTDAIKSIAQHAKNQVIELWVNRFNNSNLTKKEMIHKAQFAMYIYKNPHLITDKQGNTLKKANGENWYTSPNTISRFLPI